MKRRKSNMFENLNSDINLSNNMEITEECNKKIIKNYVSPIVITDPEFITNLNNILNDLLIKEFFLKQNSIGLNFLVFSLKKFKNSHMKDRLLNLADFYYMDYPESIQMI